MSAIRLEELRWPEVEARLHEGWTTVILPLGSTEQHGLHLPLRTDTEIADRLAEAVARRLGRCLVAPAVAIGCSAHHLAFPGSMSVSPETLARVVAESCIGGAGAAAGGRGWRGGERTFRQLGLCAAYAPCRGPVSTARGGRRPWPPPRHGRRHPGR